MNRLSLLVPGFLVAGCGVAPDPEVTFPPRQILPRLDDAVVAFDTAAGARVSVEDMLEALARQDVVFLGETHLDDTTHRFEEAVYRGLIERTGGRVVLSMEMFESDVQPTLDAYLAGEIDEDAFLAEARPWGNYRTGYRPLIELAREQGLPVVAANTPAKVRFAVARGGQEAWEGLSADERSALPEEIYPASAAYWERVDRATRGHMGDTGQPAETRLYNTQNLWDNSMGDACARALATHPGHVVLHVVGSFHVMNRDGTVAQFLRRAPNAKAAVVAVQPTSSLHGVSPSDDAARADYLVYALSVARASEGGKFAVSIPSELRYELDLPDAAPGGAGTPLLIWLPGRDVRTADARALWRAEIGDHAAVATVVHAYPERRDDLAGGGRWAQPATDRADYGRLAYGLERMVEYLARHYGIDPARVAVGGADIGADAASWIALYGGDFQARYIAVEPTDLSRFQQEPLPSERSSAERVDLMVREASAPGLESFVSDCIGLGMYVRSTSPGDVSVSDLVRDALALPNPAESDRPELILALDRGNPRARLWAELHAAAASAGGRRARVVAIEDLDAAVSDAQERGVDFAVRPLRISGAAIETDAPAEASWRAEDFATGRGLPQAPGAFGGTTIVVVPDSVDADEAAAWRELGEDDVLRKRNRFASLRVAFESESPTLEDQLSAVRDAGRRNVLIVPAEFCATAERMRALQATTGSLEGLEVSWLPGLGAACRALWDSPE